MKFIFVDFYILWESKRIGFVRSVIESKKYVFAGMRKEAPSTHLFFMAAIVTQWEGTWMFVTTILTLRSRYVILWTIVVWKQFPAGVIVTRTIAENLPIVKSQFTSND